MRPHSRGLDRVWLLVVGFSLVVALPFVLRPGLPRNTDAELYEYRSLEVRRIFQVGTLYSRWAPDFNFALGSPVFNFLAPLPHYLAGVHQEITEVGPVESIKLWLGISILAAASGMYWFVRQRWGKRAGLAAALVYLFSPPIAFALPYQTGDLAPLMALAILPWALWGISALYLQPGRQSLWIATLTLTAFWLTDCRIALLGIPVILAALVSLNGEAWVGGRIWRIYRYLLFSIVVAALLTAFFWLPALAERHDANWIPFAPEARSAPIPFTESLAFVPIYNMRVLNPPLTRSVGFATSLLALLGAGALVKDRRNKALIQSVSPYLVVGLVMLVLSSPVASGLWSAGFQMPRPYDAMLIAVFCLSVLAGQSVSWLKILPSRFEAPGLGLLLAIVPLTALPVTRPPAWTASANDPDYLSMIQDEVRGHHLGSFRDGMLLPGPELNIPDPPTDLVTRLSANNLVKIRSLQSAGTYSLSTLEQNLFHDRYLIDSSQPLPVEFYTLYDPSWVVEMDGHSLSTSASTNGLLAFTIPLAANELTLSLQPTSIQSWSWLVTTLGLLVLLRGSWLIGRRTTPIASATGWALDSTRASPVARGEILAATLVLLACVLTSIALNSAPTLLFPEAPQDKVLTAGTDVSLASKSELPPSLQAGQTFNLTLLWQANIVLSMDYQSEVQLVSNNGTVLSWTAHRHPGDVPSSSWRTDQTVSDTFSLQVPPGAATGEYSVQVRLGPCDSKLMFVCDDRQTFQVLPAPSVGDSTVPGVVAALGKITVSAP
jgi:hypothetical protein